MKEIIFSGANYYGAGALKSLQAYFDRIYVLSSNPYQILNLLRADDILIEKFSEAPCQYVFLGGHAPLITPGELKEKTYINVHGALLPKYRGMHPTFWAIMNEEKELGITIHLVDEYMDSGDIISQYSFAYHGQTVQEINDSICQLVLLHTGKDVDSFISGGIVPRKQDPSQATFGCRRNLEDCLIDFSWSNKTISLFFRALTEPYPLPRVLVKDQVYEVTEHSLIERRYCSAIGRVLNIDSQGIWIKTTDGFLIISRLRDVQSGAETDPRTLVKTGYRMEFKSQALSADNSI